MNTHRYKLFFTLSRRWQILSEKWLIAIVWRLPDCVIRWCVVRAAVKTEPNNFPGNVTVQEMLETFK